MERLNVVVVIPIEMITTSHLTLPSSAAMSTRLSSDMIEQRFMLTSLFPVNHGLQSQDISVSAGFDVDHSLFLVFCESPSFI